MKLEIKFRDSSFIYNFIKRSIESIFVENEINNNYTETYDTNRLVNMDEKFNINDNYNKNTGDHSSYNNKQNPLFTPEQINTDNFRLIGQYKSSYILIEKDGELTLIDQHNGHERANFDKLKSSYKEHKIDRSTPLFPVIIELSHTEMLLLDKREDRYFTENRI